MSDSTDGKDGEICGDIERQIFRRWLEGDSPDRIAKQISLPVGDVYRRLKRMQKERIAEQGEGDYVKRREF